ncbi:DEAD/DEAH box helicase family protein [Amycolatopsis sp. CM201R]|nr:DEAD/DEAH box helicase family protein [Amycolatopsis sp. 505]MDS0149671.1 DEAD/DEAH box helicase family protein [Amycolatopsis sp. CM201R]
MTPATVVMPTGTGKTETMLALLVAARPARLLVLVPSDSLREQVATKFETLGVLQELGIVDSAALRPVVGRVQHGFTTVETATGFAKACNVIVATPLVINCVRTGSPGCAVGRLFTPVHRRSAPRRRRNVVEHPRRVHR